MPLLRQIPFARLLLALCAGILAQMFYPFHGWQLPVLAMALVVVTLLLSVWIQMQKRFVQRHTYGVMLVVTVFVCGIWTVEHHQPLFVNPFDSNKSYTVQTYLTDQPIEKQSTYKAFARVTHVGDSARNTVADYNLLVYLQKDSLSAQLQSGDRLLLQCRITGIENAGNPHEFDYKQYLALRDIHVQAYVRSGDWQILAVASDGNVLQLLAYRARAYFLSIFRKYDFTGNEFAVASALTLGYRSDIDNDTLRAYSASGAMHVLSVSGLHVGVVFLMLNFFLSFMDKKRGARVAKAAIILGALWFFAFMSGMSASVQRSVVMLSFVVIGKLFERYVSVQNTLSASAFMLLVAQPYLITDIGFQLSYIAILSIVLIQPHLDTLIPVRNKWLKGAVSLLTASVAAQIGTAPLGFFYFNQFPNYFLITNLIVVPLSSLVLYAAIPLFALSWIDPVGWFIAKLIYYMVKGMNMSVGFIEQLPFAVTDKVYWSLVQVLLAYIVLLAVLQIVATKQKTWLYVALAALLLWVGNRNISAWSNARKSEIVVYNTRNASAINLLTARHNIVIADSTVLADQRAISFAMQKYWLINGSSTPLFFTPQQLNDTLVCDSLNQRGDVYARNGFFATPTCKIYVVRDNKLLQYMPLEKIQVDALVLSNNARVEIGQLATFFDYKLIVIDASNNTRQRNRWITDCQRVGIAVYSVAEQGAWVSSR